jgi:hypothetical protein
VTEPQTFKGYSAVATLYPDRVEIRRNRFAKLAGHKDSTTYLADVLKPHGKPPTRLVNGYVHLATESDPPHLRTATLEVSKTWMGNERSLLFTWNQRDTQTKFLAAVLAMWRQTYHGREE